MYCIIFVISVIVMLYSSYSPRSNKFIFFMNCLLFACATTHFAITFNGFYLTLVSCSAICPKTQPADISIIL